MIYKPTNFIDNNRSSSVTAVKYTLSNGIDVVYSSMGNEIKDVIANNVTTASNIISHITITSGEYFSTANRMRKDTHYGS